LSGFSTIFAEPKSVIWMCISSPRRIFSGFRSLQ